MKSVFTLSILALAVSASAQTYMDLGIARVETGIGTDNGMITRLGYNIDKTFSVEGTVTGVNQSMIAVTQGINVPVRTEYRGYGIYGKARYAINPQMEVYGRLGVMRSRVEATASYAGVSSSASDNRTSASYGVGASYNFTPVVYGSVDYTVFYRDGGKISGPSASIGYRF